MPVTRSRARPSSSMATSTACSSRQNLASSSAIFTVSRTPMSQVRRLCLETERRCVKRDAGDGKRYWADTSNLNAPDETLGNWMTKVDKIHPNEFVDASPEGTSLVGRIEYRCADGKTGFFELSRATPPTSTNQTTS